MTAESKMDFLNALRPIGSGVVADIVRGANFLQLVQMIVKLGDAKFTQDPHPLMERMKQAATPTKEELEQHERRKEAFINSLFTPLF